MLFAIDDAYDDFEMDDEIDTCPLATTQSLKQQVRTEVVKEMKNRLEVTEKALELACKYNMPEDEHSHITLRFSDTGVQVDNWQELKEYALKQAEKELKGE